jgi:group II intron reverse transcriptase/maturase
MADFTLDQLREAFEAVKNNRGCAGVDGDTLPAFAKNLQPNLSALQDELSSGRYRPLPLLKILVAKKNGEPRGLSIPAVRDRVAQRAALARIEPVLEREFEDCSFAYRKGRSIRQAVLRIKGFYEQGYRWVVEADIDAFFDNVDHVQLMKKVCANLKDPGLVSLVEKWVKAEVWDGRSLKRIEKGIPQGSALSPILANLFLDELDEAMLARGFRFIRYADDFVILCRSREQAFECLACSKEALAGLSLRLDEEDVTSFSKGFRYLGVFFLNSLIMTPFQTPKRRRRILYYPPPMDLEAYRRGRRGES